MILIVSCVFPPEPVVSAQISGELAVALSGRDETVVLCPRPSRPRGIRFDNSDNAKATFTRIVIESYVQPKPSVAGRMYESFSFGRHCYSYIKKNRKRISVIYANTWPLFSQQMVVKAARKYGIPVIIHIHDIYPETITDRIRFFGRFIKSILLPVDKYVIGKSDMVLTLGDKMAEYLSLTRNVARDKIKVIYNWQDDRRFTDSSSNTGDKTVFTYMFLGSLSPSANLEAVIHAFGRACPENTRLIIAGSGSAKDNCVGAAGNYPGTLITFIDAPSDKAPEILSMADVFILPLKPGVGQFAFPSKLSAYMLSGRPVLAYIDPDNDAAGAIRKSDCGWIIPPGDEQAFIKLLKELPAMSETELRQKGEKGKLFAMKYFSKSEGLGRLTEYIMTSRR